MRSASWIVSCAAGLLVIANAASAQTSQNQSWTSLDEQKSSSGNLNPIRIQKTHTERDGKIIDRQSLQRLGPEGKYVPYTETEKETVKVNDSTVRTVTRTFGAGADGQKMLVQVMEEEARKLPGDESRTVRTTSNPDANGRLQVVQRELENS